jgi:hypothetical protein
MICPRPHRRHRAIWRLNCGTVAVAAELDEDAADQLF